MNLETPECCGMVMQRFDLWNIRIYTCYYRDHHPKIYVNTATGERYKENYG